MYGVGWKGRERWKGSRRALAPTPTNDHPLVPSNPSIPSRPFRPAGPTFRSSQPGSSFYRLAQPINPTAGQPPFPGDGFPPFLGSRGFFGNPDEWIFPSGLGKNSILTGNSQSNFSVDRNKSSPAIPSGGIISCPDGISFQWKINVYI